MEHLAFDQSLYKLGDVLEKKGVHPDIVRILDQFNGRLARECAQRGWYPFRLRDGSTGILPCSHHFFLANAYRFFYLC